MAAEFTGTCGSVNVGWQIVRPCLGDVGGVWLRSSVPVMRAITETSCLPLKSLTNFCRDSLLLPKLSTDNCLVQRNSEKCLGHLWANLEIKDQSKRKNIKLNLGNTSSVEVSAQICSFGASPSKVAWGWLAGPAVSLLSQYSLASAQMAWKPVAI